MNMNKIVVSENKRFLMEEDGTPFFWQGDTAWELFHALNIEEAELYLKTRKTQGFNVIQAVALAENDGLNTPNAYGRVPLLKNADGNYDLLQWDLEGTYSYWDHVDAVLDLAERLELYVAFVLTWGDKYFTAHGLGPVVMRPDNACEYAKKIVERFGHRKNLIWVLGGDRYLAEYDHFLVNEEMARGMKEADEDRHLITFHPAGNRSSSCHFPKAEWLSFHMLQSGHNARNYKNYEMIAHDYELTPVKPTLDGEPRYEDHPIDFKADNGYFDQADVRQAAYWGVFAGGCGNTYGHHSVWSMNRKFTTYFPLTWEQALGRPGAAQMMHLKNLMLSFDYFSRVPDQSLLTENTTGANYIACTRGKDYALFYAPNGTDIPVDMTRFGGKEVMAKWYCPRTGVYTDIGPVEMGGEMVFSPTQRGRDKDIVLCLTIG